MMIATPSLSTSTTPHYRPWHLLHVRHDGVRVVFEGEYPNHGTAVITDRDRSRQPGSKERRDLRTDVSPSKGHHGHHPPATGGGSHPPPNGCPSSAWAARGA